MLLADAGADVLRIDRAVPGRTHTAGVEPPVTGDMLARHKASIAVDLKSSAGVALVRELARTADVVIDPFRPGVLEKLGLGPDELCARNPRLIYGRMTGFRRDGRYALMAGHDINYLAVSGVLSVLGRDGEKPHPPWNILADFAGGGATLFQGVLLAVVARASSGRGQVVEANMADGAAYLATFPRQALRTPLGDAGRGRNMLDGGSPYYDTYATRDPGGYMAVGALEPQFFAALVRGLGLDPSWNARRNDRDNWPALRRELEARFAERTRAEWEAVFDGTDACCTPVLGWDELAATPRPEREGDQRPHVTLRGTPLLAVHEGEDNGRPRDPVILGQGPGVPGGGYEGLPVGAGEGGEEALGRLFGMRKGDDFEIEKGGLVLVSGHKSRL